MEELKKDIWSEIQTAFKSEFGLDTYNAWLSKIKLSKIIENQISLSVETRFIKEYITREYFSSIVRKGVVYKKGIKQILNEFGITSIDIFVASVSQEQIIPSNKNNVESISPNNNLFSIGLELNKNYTFENFIVGESNKIAFEIANSLINETCHSYNINPLFIYGNVGVGKTHLLQAIAWKLRDKYKDKNITYLSAQKFMDLFIISLQKNNMNDFKERFKNIDILLIDDIQFIAGKDGTQKEFFYTFNAFKNANKTIIMACDKSPEHLINVDEQLKSRIGDGVTIDMALPDYDLRLKIAEQKAKTIGLQCNQSVYEYIANVKNTSRDIEGAIKNLFFEQTIMKKNIDLDYVTNFLKQKVKKNITISLIKEKVCEFYKISHMDLTSKARKGKLPLQRQIAFYLARTLTEKSYPDIAKEFDKKHTTIMYGYEEILNNLKTNMELSKEIEEIKKVILF